MAPNSHGYTKVDGTESEIMLGDKRPGKVFETTMGLTVFVWYNRPIEALGAYGMDRTLLDKVEKHDVDLIIIDDADIAVPIERFKDEAEVKRADDDFYNNTRTSEELIYYVENLDEKRASDKTV